MPICKIKDIIYRVKDKVSIDCGLKYYVAGEHFDSNEVIVEKKGNIEGSTIGPAFHMRFKPGQVLLMSRNPHLRKAGLVNFEGICSDVSYVCETKDETKFKQNLIPFLFQSDIFWKKAEENKRGSTNFFLNWSDFEEFEINIPKPTEQEYLCNLLWAGEKVRQQYKKLLQKTDDIIKAKFIEMFGDPITNTKKWNTEPLKKVAPQKNIDIQYNDIVWLLNLDMIESNTGNIIKKIMVNKNEIGASTTTFTKDMVLYSKLRPYLNKVVVPDENGFATTELVTLLPNKNILNKYFLAELLRSKSFLNFAIKLSEGARMPRMPINELRNFNCILPPKKLQDKFAEFVEQAEQTKQQLKLSLDTLNKTIKSIVQENFN